MVGSAATGYGRSRLGLLRTALLNRDIARLEASWALASLGMWSFSILLALYAYNKHGAGGVGLAMAVRMLPSALAAPYAALLADTHSRRGVLLGAAAGRAAVLAVIGLVILAGAPFAVVLALSAAVPAVATVQKPAQAALLPYLARTPAELAAAHVGWSGLDYLAFLAGSLLAGVLAAATGLGTAFMICGLPLLLAAAVLVPMRADFPLVPHEAGSALAGVLAGMRTVRAHPQIRLLTGIFGADMFVQAMLDLLLVVLALQVLRIGRGSVGWLSAAWGVGGVCGGAAALALLHRGRLASGLAYGCGVVGTSLVLLGAFGDPVLAAILLVLSGVGFGVVEIALLTLTQRLASNDVLARVVGVNEVVYVVGSAAGSGAAAALVGLLGGRGALAVAGLLLPSLGLLMRGRLGAFEASASVPERPYKLLRKLPFAEFLPVATIENLALRSTAENFEPREVIAREGAVGDRFYVIESGRVAVDEHGVFRRHQSSGEFFGEIALLRDIPRTATVRAETPVSVLEISRDDFLAAIGSHPHSRRTVESVASERLQPTRRSE